MIIKNSSRIDILDGFRTIAILAVVLYHFLYRWNDDNFPYFIGFIFHYGYKGVSFFFMISGFVICYTLRKTNSFKEFWIKRFIRLFPSMLIASFLTFTFLFFFNYKHIFEDNYFRNLLISLTFLPPQLFNLILGKENHFSYINSDYWSLWPEIQFYFISSFFYFFNKENFNRNFLFFLFSLLICYEILLFYRFNEIVIFDKIFNFLHILAYLPYFIAGTLFYFIYFDKKSIRLNFFLLIVLFSILNSSLDMISFISNSLMFLLFILFIFYPNSLHFLTNKMILSIGTSSYFLYLIHEYIGTVWIKNIVPYFYPHSIIAPLLIILTLIVFSVFYTKKVESKIIKFLNRKLLKKRE